MWGEGLRRPSNCFGPFSFLFHILISVFSHPAEDNSRSAATFSPGVFSPSAMWAVRLSVASLFTHLPSARCPCPSCNLHRSRMCPRAGMCRSQVKLGTSLYKLVFSLMLCVKVLETSNKGICKKGKIPRKGEMLGRE